MTIDLKGREKKKILNENDFQVQTDVDRIDQFILCKKRDKINQAKLGVFK